MIPKDPQDILEFVVKGLIAQGGPSMKNGGCAYRGNDGRKCAAGLLISDEFYLPLMEGKGASFDPVEAALVSSGVPASALHFIASLQEAHDGAAMDCRPHPETFWTHFARRLQGVCAIRGLKYPEHLMGK